MPMLNWLGKNEVIRHAHNIPYHVLNHKYNFGGASDNMIIHGDNLLALRSLLPEYECRVKCIYIDPPYNTGNENWVYNDNVNSAQIQRWLHQVVGKDDLSRHDKWLCMMYPRLSLLKKLLADDGAIFISIDDNEVANLRLLCNEIFGEQNFVAQFAWKRKKEISNDSRNVSTQGEYILCYSKTSQTELYFEPLSDEYVKKSYRPPNEEFSLGYWRPVPIAVSSGLNGGGYEYTIETPFGRTISRQWTYPQHRYEELLRDNRIYFGKDGNAIPQRVMYLAESKGKPVSNYWEDVATNKEGKKEIINMFDADIFSTPKPTRLIEKILRLATDKNAIVLDSFAGSGTTAHAVLNLNAQDGGNRKFILVEMEDYADNITAERVKRVINGYGKVDGTGGNFNFYEVGDSLVVDDELNDDIDIEIIRSYIWFSETRTRYVKPLGDNPAYLGTHNDTAYYFHHERGTVTNLDDEFLRGVVDAAHYVIYADKCTLDESDLNNYNITFKKIPRDVR